MIHTGVGFSNRKRQRINLTCKIAADVDLAGGLLSGICYDIHKNEETYSQRKLSSNHGCLRA